MFGFRSFRSVARPTATHRSRSFRPGFEMLEQREMLNASGLAIEAPSLVQTTEGQALNFTAKAGIQLSGNTNTLSGPTTISYDLTGAGVTKTTPAKGTADDVLTVKLDVLHGDLELRAATGATKGAQELDLRGTLKQINGELANLVYQPNAGFLGADDLKISVVDPAASKGAVATKSVEIDVTRPSLITAPSVVHTTEGHDFLFQGTAAIKIGTTTTGTVGGKTGTGPTTIGYNLTNGQAAGNTPTTVGYDLTTNGGKGTGPVTTGYNLTTNNPTGTGQQNTTSTDIFRVTLRVTAGSLELVTAAGATKRAQVLNLQGTTAQINAYLAELVYVPAPGFVGTADLKVTVVDEGSNGSTGAKQTAGYDQTAVVAIQVQQQATTPGFDLTKNTAG